MSTVDAAPGPGLTAREAEVLGLLQQRLTNNEIADELFLSVRTVESHVSALLRKLGVEDRRALARMAGAVPVPAPARSPGRPLLPSPLTGFVGRARELDELTGAVIAHRLVTATGPGGVGKTRLALATAHRLASEYRDGAAFVDLVRVVDPAMVDAAVADAVGASEGAADRQQTLLAALADRETLLVIDNCEHVMDGVRPCIERILTHCPGMRVLATSRIRLMLPFEHVFAVPGLSIEDAEAAQDGGDGDAAALFIARMVAAGAPEPASPQDRATVRAVCRALDGMALAIELAAARVPAIGLDGLSNALGAHLPLLTVGRRAEDRHRSLAAAIDWSYELLDDDERAALRAASVFASRFDAEALAAVTGRPLPETIVALGRLVDWNLVMTRRGPTTRYRVLETIRQYATALADASDEGEQLRTAHLDWARATLDQLLEQAPRGQDADVESWCRDVDAALDDARAALTWAAAGPERRAVACALAELIARTAFERGRPGEAQRRYEQAADLAATPAERRHLLRLAAGAAASRNVGTDAVDLLERAADLAEDADDAATDLAWAAMFPWRAGGIMRERAEPRAEALLARARSTSRGGATAEATIAMAAGWAPGAMARSRAQTEVALRLARATDPLLQSATLDQLMVVELADGDLHAALEAVRERFALLATLPADALSAFERYDAWHMGCHLFLAVGDLPEARRHAEAVASLPFFREERHISLGRRVEVDALAGEAESVVADGELIERDWTRAGRPVASNLGVGMYCVATVHRMLGDEDAHRHWVEITKGIIGWGGFWSSRTDVGWMPTLDAMALLDASDPEAAVARLAVAPDDRRHWDNPNMLLWLAWYAAFWAEAAALAGLPDAADRLRRAAHIARANPVATGIIERSAALHRGDLTPLPALAQVFADAACPYQHDRTLRLAETR